MSDIKELIQRARSWKKHDLAPLITELADAMEEQEEKFSILQEEMAVAVARIRLYDKERQDE